MRFLSQLTHLAWKHQLPPKHLWMKYGGRVISEGPLLAHRTATAISWRADRWRLTHVLESTLRAWYSWHCGCAHRIFVALIVKAVATVDSDITGANMRSCNRRFDSQCVWHSFLIVSRQMPKSMGYYFPPLEGFNLAYGGCSAKSANLEDWWV